MAATGVGTVLVNAYLLAFVRLGGAFINIIFTEFSGPPWRTPALIWRYTIPSMFTAIIADRFETIIFFLINFAPSRAT